MNEEQSRAEFEAWWANFQSEHEEWRFADREAILFQAWQAALSAKSVPVGFYHKETGELKSVITSDDGNESDWIDVYTSPKPTDDRVRELEAKYEELLMAVARKYPNETRHQTALRYINAAEVKAEQAMKGGSQ